MTFDEIFEAYYNLYRAQTTTPSSTDSEYTIGMRLANEAISRWANFDGTYWKELFTTYQESGGGTVTAGTVDYAAPDDMREAGGFVRLLDSDGRTVSRYPIVDPQQAQFLGDESKYCYFTGNPNSGFTLHLNPTPDDSVDGLDIDYVYYKKPTPFESGDDTTEMANPYYIVHRMLAMRFRASRNPYYSSALRDSEDALKIMQMDNNSGSWANPATLADNSGTTWGKSKAGDWGI